MATVYTNRSVATSLVIASTLLFAGLSTTGAYGAAQVVQPGAVHCTSATGKVAFSPPLTKSGETTDTETFGLTFTGCTALASAISFATSVPHAAGDGIGGVSVGLKKKPGGMLSNLLGKGTPTPWTVMWKNLNATDSIVQFSNYSQSASCGGNLGFKFPGSGGTASVTGSFAGTDKGASSTLQLCTNQTLSQIAAKINGGGLSSLTFTSGSLQFGNPAVVQPGAVHCTSATGKVAFSPPLTKSGETTDTETFGLTFTGCTALASAISFATSVPHAAGDGIGGVSVGLKKKPGGMLSNLLGKGTPTPWTVMWKNLNATDSIVQFSNYSQSASCGGNLGFKFPGSGGTASVTGSFAGTDKGASSTLQLCTNQTLSQIAAKINGGGLSSLTFTSGSLQFGNPAVVQPGAVHCTSATGKVAFSPPLTKSGETTDTETFGLTFTGCTALASAISFATSVPHAAGDGIGGVSVGLKKKPGGMLSNLLGKGTPTPWTVMWKNLNATDSIVQFSNYSQSASCGGNLGFKFPGSGGTASVTGSFAGTDKGASSTLQLCTNQTLSQIAAKINGGGLSSLTFTSGSLQFK